MNLREKLASSYTDGILQYYQEINAGLSERNPLYSLLMASSDARSWKETVQRSHALNPHVGAAVKIAMGVVVKKQASLMEGAAKLEPIIIDLAFIYTQNSLPDKNHMPEKSPDNPSSPHAPCSVVIPFSAKDRSNQRSIQSVLGIHIENSLNACNLSYLPTTILGIPAAALGNVEYAALEKRISDIPYGLWQVKIGMRLVRIVIPENNS